MLSVHGIHIFSPINLAQHNGFNLGTRLSLLCAALCCGYVKHLWGRGGFAGEEV
jgi:hypothetical protein